jgi:hypothetical protein
MQARTVCTVCTCSIEWPFNAGVYSVYVCTCTIEWPYNAGTYSVYSVYMWLCVRTLAFKPRIIHVQQHLA